jgi:hypothetical protein
MVPLQQFQDQVSYMVAVAVVALIHLFLQHQVDWVVVAQEAQQLLVLVQQEQQTLVVAAVAVLLAVEQVLQVDLVSSSFAGKIHHQMQILQSLLHPQHGLHLLEQHRLNI